MTETRISTQQLNKLSEEQILALRFSQLHISIRGTWAEKGCKQLQKELRAKGLRIPLYFWLSDEWFSPDGTTGIAIPFYLAHPKLMALEKRQINEIEGGSHKELMKLLRHEAGHVIENVFGTRRLKKRQILFGKTSVPYPKDYLPKPFSRKHVRHLKENYAQAHPDEDFAETFAVWLDPKSNWQKRYANWPALKKLEYMNKLMSELRHRPLKRMEKVKVSELKDLKKTLSRHYIQKRQHWGLETDPTIEPKLKKIFSSQNSTVPAHEFLKQNQKHLCKKTSQLTQIRQYHIQKVIRDLRKSTRQFGLNQTLPLAQTEQELVKLLADHSKKLHQEGFFRIAF